MIKRRFILMCFAAAVLALDSLPASAQVLDRGLSISSLPSFVGKGSWMVGGTGSWGFHDNDNYSFLIADGVSSTGYKVNVSPAFCYMIKDNMGVGARLVYQRGMLKVDDASLGFGDLGLDVHDYHTLSHSYQIQGIMRNFIPIGLSRKFALYNEVQLAYKIGTSKVVNGAGEAYDGSFGQNRALGLNLCPGLTAFINDHWAVDVNVNMLGLNLGQTKQTHNMSGPAETNSTILNFNINILAIGFGLYCYF